MRLTFKTCRVHGCTTNAVAYDLLCLKHWRMVPAKLAGQVRITHGWVRGKDGESHRDAYDHACREAVEAVDRIVTPPGVGR